MITVAVTCLLLGAVLGWTARHFRAASWAAARLAPSLHAGWFITAQPCSGCGRHAHLMRTAGPGEYFCVWRCGALYAAYTAPDRTETGENAGLGVLGWPQDTPGHSGTPAGTTITGRDEQ